MESMSFYEKAEDLAESRPLRLILSLLMLHRQEEEL